MIQNEKDLYLISNFRNEKASKMRIAFPIILFSFFSIVIFALFSSFLEKKEKKLNSFTDDDFNWAPAGDKLKTKW